MSNDQNHGDVEQANEWELNTDNVRTPDPWDGMNNIAKGDYDRDKWYPSATANSQPIGQVRLPMGVHRALTAVVERRQVPQVIGSRHDLIRHYVYIGLMEDKKRGLFDESTEQMIEKAGLDIQLDRTLKKLEADQKFIDNMAKAVSIANMSRSVKVMEDLLRQIEEFVETAEGNFQSTGQAMVGQIQIYLAQLRMGS